MKFLLLLLLSPACQAQMNTLPENVDNEPTAADLNYLSQKINNLAVTPATFLNCTSSSTINCITLPNGEVINSTDSFGGTTVTSVSSCTADLSGIPAITQSGHHFVLGLSTITVTVNNTTYPVDVCFNGVLREVGSGPWHGWSFLVDSNYVLTMTRDFGCQSDSGGNPNQGPAVASGCCRLPKGTITNASHTFAFLPDGNLGNTIQAGFTNSVSYFCVSEVH